MPLPVFIAAMAVLCILALWVFVQGVRRRKLEREARIARAILSSASEPQGPTLQELADQIHRELVARLLTTRLPEHNPGAAKRDIRRMIEHLVDTACPLLNVIERAALIEEVLGRIPRFAA